MGRSTGHKPTLWLEWRGTLDAGARCAGVPRGLGQGRAADINQTLVDKQ